MPSEVATSLYNLALLEKAELSKLNTLNEEDKALAIVLHLQKILLSKPELFSDVYAALKKVGVRAIQDIKGIGVFLVALQCYSLLWLCLSCCIGW